MSKHGSGALLIQAPMAKSYFRQRKGDGHSLVDVHYVEKLWKCYGLMRRAPLAPSSMFKALWKMKKINKIHN